MIKELKTYVVQLTVQTLNETAIYHIKSVLNTRQTQYLEMTQYSVKNQLSMHGNDENTLF